MSLRRDDHLKWQGVANVAICYGEGKRSRNSESYQYIDIRKGESDRLLQDKEFLLDVIIWGLPPKASTSVRQLAKS